MLWKIHLGYGMLKSCSPQGYWNFLFFFDIIEIYGHDNIESGYRSSHWNSQNGSPWKYLKSYTVFNSLTALWVASVNRPYENQSQRSHAHFFWHRENFWAFTGSRIDFGLVLLISNLIIHRNFTGPTHLPSANVRGPVSFALSEFFFSYYKSDLKVSI